MSQSNTYNPYPNIQPISREEIERRLVVTKTKIKIASACGDLGLVYGLKVYERELEKELVSEEN